MIMHIQTNLDNILWLCHRFMTVRKDTASGKVGDDKSTRVIVWQTKHYCWWIREPAKLHGNATRQEKTHWQEQIRGKRR